MENKNDVVDEVAIARALDSITEQEFCKMFKVTPLTARRWRQSGIAPLPVLLGNTFIYPLSAIKEEMQNRVREPRSTGRKGMGVIA
jgi:hypothetical protein